MGGSRRGGESAADMEIHPTVQAEADLNSVEFRSAMDKVGDFMANSHKSCVIHKEKYDDIVEFLKYGQASRPNFRSWVQSRGFRLMDFGPDEKDVLVRPACVSKTSKQEGPSELVPVLHARSLFDVTKHVHTNVFQHSGYKRVLAYMQARYFGVTRGYVQQFCSRCPVCRTFRRHPASNLCRKSEGSSSFEHDPESHLSFNDETQGSHDKFESAGVVGEGVASHTYVGPGASEFVDGDGDGDGDVTEDAGNDVKVARSIDNRNYRTIVDGDDVYYVTVREDSDSDVDDSGTAGQASKLRSSKAAGSAGVGATLASSQGHHKAGVRSGSDGDKSQLLVGQERCAKGKIITRKRTRDDASKSVSNEQQYPVVEGSDASSDQKIKPLLVSPKACSIPTSPSQPGAKKARRQQTPSRSPENHSSEFFSEVQIDVIDMTQSPDGKYRYICHVVDAAHKLHVLFPLKDCAASVLAAKLDQRVLAVYGLPRTLYSNMGHAYLQQLLLCLSDLVEGGIACVNGEVAGRRRHGGGTNVVEELIAMLRLERGLDRVSGHTPWLSWLPRIMRSLNRDWHAALRRNGPVAC